MFLDDDKYLQILLWKRFQMMTDICIYSCANRTHLIAYKSHSAVMGPREWCDLEDSKWGLFIWYVFTGVFLSLINSILQRPSYLGKMVTFCSLYGKNFLSKYHTKHWIVWFNSFWIIHVLHIYILPFINDYSF